MNNKRKLKQRQQAKRRYKMADDKLFNIGIKVLAKEIRKKVSEGKETFVLGNHLWYEKSCGWALNEKYL